MKNEPKEFIKPENELEDGEKIKENEPKKMIKSDPIPTYLRKNYKNSDF